MDATPPPVVDSQPEPLPLPEPAPEPLPLVPAEPAPSPDTDHPHPPLGFTLRRLLHIIALLFCLFLVVRTTFVEPFGVTTGSMAETIRGNRHERACWRCGCPVCVGTADDTRGTNPQSNVYCPNCGAGHDPTIPAKLNAPGGADLTDEPETFGDRLMVDKLVYRLRSPRRWEVAVFRCPDPTPRAKGIEELSAFEAKLPLYDGPTPCENTTYVKRVVGLPGERIRVHDGDVYADGRIQRKTLQQVRETRIPVVRMDHLPQSVGWAERWEVGPPPDTAPLPKVTPPALPTVGDVVQGSSLHLDATAAPFGLTYRHRHLDVKKDYPIRDGIAYNGSPAGQFADTREDGKGGVPVHDFMVECELEVVGGEKGAFTVRLGDGADTVKVHLPIHPDTGGGTAAIAHEGGDEQPFARAFALVPGKRHRLEFGFIDRRVLVAIDGKEVAAPLDLAEVSEARRRPREPIPNKPTGSQWEGLTRPLQFDCRGGHVVVHHFTLWRDIHYRSDSSAKHGVAGEWRLGPDEYFMLGDNTANSRDSREWATPGVPERHFLGKPFLVHQPLKAAARPLWAGQQVLDFERLRLLE